MEIKLEQTQELELSPKQKIESRLEQTIQQNIMTVPILHISNVLKKSFSLRLNERETENLFDLLNDSIHSLKQKGIDSKYRFVDSLIVYDCFKFLIPELEFSSEGEELIFKEKIKKIEDTYLEIMRREPYNMEENNKPIALNLYYRFEDQEFSKEFDYVINDSLLLNSHKINFRKDKNDTYFDNSNVKQCKNALVKKINNINEELRNKLEYRRFDEIEPLQLRALALGVKIPSLYNLKLNETNESKELLDGCEYYYGEFEMPISKYFQKEIKNIIKDN